MAEIGLQCPRILALASQREATGMPQHMGMGLDPQLGLDELLNRLAWARGDNVGFRAFP